MEPSDYKHVVLGLIFLKYISDAFEAKREHLLRDAADPESFYYVKEEAARYAIADRKDPGQTGLLGTRSVRRTATPRSGVARGNALRDARKPVICAPALRNSFHIVPVNASSP
jgi:hypothetical protein